MLVRANTPSPEPVDVPDAGDVRALLTAPQRDRQVAARDHVAGQRLRRLPRRVEAEGGEVVKRTGDGFFASFDNPKAAIAAAVAIQRALDAEIVAPDVRIGAHTGDAFENDGDANAYGGEAVHIAARIGAAAGANAGSGIGRVAAGCSGARGGGPPAAQRAAKAARRALLTSGRG